MSFTIAVETPLQDDVRALVSALNEWALEQTPREFTPPHDGRADGCSPTRPSLSRAMRPALPSAWARCKRHGDGLGEVKRMFTRPRRAAPALPARSSARSKSSRDRKA